MSDIQLCDHLNENHLTFDNIRIVEEFCQNLIKISELYKLQNDAKLRAVISSKTYEEFKDIVDAAHLKSLNQHDKKARHCFCYFCLSTIVH